LSWGRSEIAQYNWGVKTVRTMNDAEKTKEQLQRELVGLRQRVAALEEVETERRRAEAQLSESLERLRNAIEETVQAMALTVETRDPYTAGHQQRVAELACAISREIGLSEDRIDGIRLAGVIHDIGKVYVPSEFLSKPTQLSVLEFAIIKQHAQVGYEILKGIDFPWPVSEAVLQHHERNDGSGYPQGLFSQDILKEAKILAVADVVEAMSSHRPYHPALGLETALEEINQHKGLRYDPEAVNACSQLIASRRFEFVN